MPYLVTSNSSNRIAVGTLVINSGTPVSVSELNTDLIAAYQSKLISISPAPVSINNPLTILTDSTTGVVNAGGTLVAVAAYTDVDNNLATVAVQINNLNKQVTALMGVINQIAGNPSI